MPKLPEAIISAALTALPRWTLVQGKLHRDYVFPDFIHAFAFMTAAAIGIEKQNHHPEWFNVYNKVTVDLTTHDAGGITQKDIDLALAMEGLANKLA